MSSRTRTLRAAALVGLAALTVLAACGRRGDPSPPIRYVPATTQDLSIAQRGRELLLNLTYPSATSAGLPLPSLEWVELWELVRPAPEDGQALPASRAEFEARAQLLETFRGDDLNRLVVGDRLVIERVLREEGREPAVAEMLTFAVRSASSERDVSEFSNMVTMIPQLPPPAPPSTFEAEGRGDGVRLSWQPPPGDPPLGFYLYRRAPQERVWGEPIHKLALSAGEYVDTTARFGQRYVYGLTAVSKPAPLIESAPAGVREVDYVDRYAPPTPTELVALAEPGRVRLIWRGERLPDLAGYRVYRRPVPSAVTAFAPLGGADAALAPRAESTDSTGEPGATYAYQVTAVDEAGNESAPSNEARATLPR